MTMWERRAELEGFAAVMEGVHNAAPRLAGRAIAGPHDYAQIPELVERSKRRVANFYSDMDTRLGDVSFIAGKNFSAADITTLVAVDFATRALDMLVPAESRALGYWYERRRGKTERNRIVGFYEQKPILEQNKASCSMHSTRCRTNVAKTQRHGGWVGF